MSVRQEWDLAVGVLYLNLRPDLTKGAVARTVAIDDGTNVDLDAAGTVLGIEVLDPGTPWPLLGVMQRFPQISDEDFRELAALYPFPVPTVEVTGCP